MKQALESIRTEVLEAIAAADSKAALEEIRVQALGKKGSVTAILKQMGKLSPEERPVMGALSPTRCGQPSRRRWAPAPKRWRAAELEHKLAAERIDVTLPGKASPHRRAASADPGAQRA